MTITKKKEVNTRINHFSVKDLNSNKTKLFQEETSARIYMKAFSDKNLRLIKHQRMGIHSL